MAAAGKKRWVIPCGRIPLRTTGKEPEFLSQDRIAVLNLNKDPVKIKLTFFYSDQEAAGGYEVVIQGERVRKIRINDIINPLPVYLEKDYSMLIEADKTVVVQFLKMNTSSRDIAITGTIAFGTDI
jgi:hypothetical protein